MGLLAVGMMTVYSKRTIRTLAVDLDRKEAELEELQRREDILDTDLATSLNPEYLKQLVSMANLRLGPPREDRIIVVNPNDGLPRNPKILEVHFYPTRYQNRFAIANNELGDGD
tara:strand:+ start:5353 stop:5694 length:342 start_codon:yes stop_codon:yes gene_type:complete